MDMFLRGAVEKHIDFLLSESNLNAAYETLTKRLSPMVGNVNDALFGYVVGRALEFCFLSFNMFYRRKPSSNDFVEIGKILERRAMEIKSKITLITNK